MHEMARKQGSFVRVHFFLDPPSSLWVYDLGSYSLVGVGFHPGDQPF